MYAKAFFENMQFDAVTVAPYMGEDSITPFLSYENKWVILLALSSNKVAYDFQYHSDDDVRLFEKVLLESKKWGNTNNLMYVIGATKAEMLSSIRKIVPDNFLLVPGIGAQGGNLQKVCNFGINDNIGLIINSSRGIIYAANDITFAERAEKEAINLQNEMSKIIQKIIN